LKFLRFIKSESNTTKKLLHLFLGFKPHNLNIYVAALTHSSVNEKEEENNERLEFLGDAILNAMISDYLFKKYPYKGEGFLTEMRSKMVNRAILNEIALKIGLKKIAIYNKLDKSFSNSQIFGNTLEALIGAIFIDKGHRKCYKWIRNHLIIPHLSIEDLESLEINQKNILYGWASKNNKTIEFNTINEEFEKGRKWFTMAILINGKKITEAKSYSKKVASKIAATQAVKILNLKTE